jgi:hypothetical protein
MLGMGSKRQSTVGVKFESSPELNDEARKRNTDMRDMVTSLDVGGTSNVDSNCTNGESRYPCVGNPDKLAICFQFASRCTLL